MCTAESVQERSHIYTVLEQSGQDRCYSSPPPLSILGREEVGTLLGGGGVHTGIDPTVKVVDRRVSREVCPLLRDSPLFQLRS
jgi:hypothetical protein